MFLADGRSPQRAVVRASFDYHNASTPLASKATVALHRLQYSAAIIEKWNSMCPLDTLHTLQKQNRPILVRVLTHSGPQYWVKPLTAKCIRHSRELYVVLEAIKPKGLQYWKLLHTCVHVIILNHKLKVYDKSLLL